MYALKMLNFLTYYHFPQHFVVHLSSLLYYYFVSAVDYAFNEPIRRLDIHIFYISERIGSQSHSHTLTKYE